MKTLNINSKVRIKLTPCGIEKLKRKHEELRSLCPSIGNFTPPKVDKDGYCKMQLAVVMANFGEYIFPTFTKYPFEPNILIDDTELEEA